MRYARLENNEVLEIIESVDIQNQFHPDYIKNLVEVDENVKIGMVYKNGNFILPEIINPIIKNNVISAVEARLKLNNLGLLKSVLDYTQTQEDTNPIKIKWEYSINLHRDDEDLITFCKSVLKLSDADIDKLFEI